MGSISRPIYSLDDIPGVDLTDVGLNKILKHNGTNFVCVDEGASFAFGVASFSDNEDATQLAGIVGSTWRLEMPFSMSYTNGPPTSGTISCASWGSPASRALVEFDSWYFVGQILYPNPGVSITFTLNVLKDFEFASDTETVTFANNILSGTTIMDGVTFPPGPYIQPDLDFMNNRVEYLSNTKGRSFTVTASTDEYIIYALPVRLGTVTFMVNGFTGGFMAPQIVSLTNSNSYAENYYVYRSTNHSLGVTSVTVV